MLLTGLFLPSIYFISTILYTVFLGKTYTPGAIFQYTGQVGLG